MIIDPEVNVMIFAILASYTLVATGGLAIGALYGRSAGAAAAGIAHSISSRLAAVEHSVHLPFGASAQHAAAMEHHACAIEKLAGAIEKHAAAVDDHGAATVAAAVECRAGAISLAAMPPEPKN
jgi:hypothetical protein